MNFKCNNESVILNQINFITFKDYCDIKYLINVLTSEESQIEGSSIKKYFKIIKLLDYLFEKENLTRKKNSLYCEYIRLKYNNLSEKQKDVINSKYQKILNSLMTQINIDLTIKEENFFDYIFTLITSSEINFSLTNIDDIINYITKENSTTKYIILTDSSKYNIEVLENTIILDINTNKNLADYNILIYDNKIKNIYIEVIVDNLFRYWPEPIKIKELLHFCNNNFINIFRKEKVYTFDKKEAIMAKFMNENYALNIKIKYLSNHQTIKSFLTN